MINVGILAAYLAGAPYEASFQGFYMSHWVPWWRVMQAIALIPVLAQVS